MSWTASGYPGYALSAFKQAQLNRRVMAGSAGRAVHSRLQTLKFLLYFLASPVLILSWAFKLSRAGSRVHFVWADKIRNTAIAPEVEVRLPNPQRLPGGGSSFLRALGLLLWRLPGIALFTGTVGDRCEFLAFLVEVFLMDVVLLNGAATTVSSASALDRKSIYLSSATRHLGQCHVVYQHGVINRFDGACIPACDVFVCCFPWSQQAVPWLYQATRVTVAPLDEWHFPGWDGKMRDAIVWATSPFPRTEATQIAQQLIREFGAASVLVKPHPRDQNVDTYRQLGFTIIDAKPTACKLFVGQISTVLAEAYVKGLEIRMLAGGASQRASCLDFLLGEVEARPKHASTHD